MRHNSNLILRLALLALVLVVVRVSVSPSVPAFAPSAAPPEPGISAGASDSADVSQEAPVPEREGTSPEVSSSPEPAAPSYEFSQPAPESEAVDNDYFADAAFVGDSRTDGLMIYSGVGCGDKFVSNGLSIFQLAEKKTWKIDGEEYTLLEALALKQYGKVYLCLGVNELGVYDDEGFYRSYCEAIDSIRALQPNAVIYIQGLIPLNEEVIAQTTKRDYLTNEHLRVYNDLIRQAAQDKQVVFLDLYTEFVDENGELPADASRDGVHLLKEGYQKWLAYLKTHTVEFEVLYPDGVPQAVPPASEASAEENASGSAPTEPQS